jgi:site-specific DNA-methyltransferase (adenine-specific)
MATTTSKTRINSIITGDCVQVLKTLPPESIDLVLTDPPYVTSYRPRDGRTVTNDDNSDWLEPAFAELYRVLRPDSFCVTFYGWPVADRFMAAFRAAGFRPVSHLSFVKRYPPLRTIRAKSSFRA